MRHFLLLLCIGLVVTTVNACFGDFGDEFKEEFEEIEEELITPRPRPKKPPKRVEKPKLSDEENARKSEHLIYKILEVTEGDTIKRYPKHVSDGVPADALLELIEQSAEFEGETAPWLTNEKVKDQVLEMKTSQTTAQMFELMGEMSTSEIHSLPWAEVGKGLNHGAFDELDAATVERLPWKAIWPHLTGDHGQMFTGKTLKAIHPTQWDTIPPEVMGGFEPKVFGQIPAASLNHAPATSFQYVTVRSWKQLGPAKFSVLREDIMNEISKQTYEDLGRSFLARVDRSQLEKLQKLEPTLPNDRPPKQIKIGHFGDARSGDEKLDHAVLALTEVVKRTRIDPATHTLPLNKEFIYELPGESLKELPKTARNALPRNFWLRRDRKLQTTARHMFKMMSIEELDNLEWQEVADEMWPSTLNSLPPDVMKSTPWNTMLSSMTGDQMSGLTSRTISSIKPEAFESMGADAFSGLSMTTIKTMTTEQFHSIPPEAFGGFTLKHFRGFGVDEINKLTIEKQEAIDWTSIAMQMESFKELEELDEKARSEIDWDIIFAHSTARKLSTLADSGVGSTSGTRSKARVEEVEYDEYVDEYDEFDEVSNGNGSKEKSGSKGKSGSTEKSGNMEEGQRRRGRRIRVQRRRTRVRRQAGMGLGSIPPEAFQQFSFKKFSSLSKEFVQSMSLEQVQNLPDDIFSQMSEEKLWSFGRDFIDKLSDTQKVLVNLEEILKPPDLSEITDLSELTPIELGKLLPDDLKNLEIEKLTTFETETFERLSQEQLEAIKWKKLMPELGVDKLHQFSPELWNRLPNSALKGLTTEQFDVLTPSLLEELSVEQLHSIPPKLFKQMTLEHIEAIGPDQLRDLHSSHTNAIPENVLFLAGEEYWEATGREQEMQSHIQYQQQELYIRIEEALSGLSYETVEDVFNEFTEDDFRKFNWNKFAKSVHSKDINILPDHIIERAPWEKMFQHFERSTVESISIDVWEKILPKKFESIPIDVIEILSSRTIGAFTEEQLDAMPTDLFKEIDGRSLLRMGEDKFSSLSVEKLNKVKPHEFRSVNYKQWEALGEEKFKLLDEDIHQHINKRSKKKVSFLKQEKRKSKIEKQAEKRRLRTQSESQSRRRLTKTRPPITPTRNGGKRPNFKVSCDSGRCRIVSS